MALRRFKHLAGIALCALSLAATAQGKYPEKPIHILVPSSAGSILDVIFRQVAEGLSRSLGQAVVVENRTGASGIIAYDAVARAKPDGYTLAAVQAGFVSNKLLYKSATYDEFKDFMPVAMVMRSPMVLIGQNGAPANSMAELKQLAKTRPGGLTYASVNGANYMNTELMRKQFDIEMRNIPYRDVGQAVNDVLSGQVDLWLSSYGTTMQMIKAGKMKAFVTMSNKRVPTLPNVPSASELGLNVDIYTWAGLLAPAGTPDAILSLLNREINNVASSPAIRKRLEDSGNEVYTLSRPEFTELMRREIGIYANVARELGIKPE